MNAAERDVIAQEIRDLAQALLDGPKSGAAIRRVQKHGDFTKQEHEAVFENELTGQAFEDWGPWRRWANIYLAVAVARQAAAGDGESVSSSAANALVDENLVTQDIDYQELYERKIHIDDLVPVLRDLARNPAYLRLLETWANAEQHEDAGEEISQAVGIENTSKRKYGINSACQLIHIMDNYRRKPFDLNDREKVKEICRKHIGTFTRIEGLEK